MGRVKVPLKKIENKTYRHITFAKRKNGLVKKAYELSTLCDTEIALIIFSPSGKLFLYDGKKRIEEILLRYIDHLEQRHGRLPNQEEVRRIVAHLSLQANFHHRFHSLSGIGDDSMGPELVEFEEIQTEMRSSSSQLIDVENELQLFIKGPTGMASLNEAAYHEDILEEILTSIHSQQGASSSNITGGTSNYNFSWEPQDNNNLQIPAVNFDNFNEFQPIMNNQFLQPSAGILPPSQANFDNFNEVQVHPIMSNQFVPPQAGILPPPPPPQADFQGLPNFQGFGYGHGVDSSMQSQQFGQLLNANPSLGGNNNEQGTTSTMVGQPSNIANGDNNYGGNYPNNFSAMNFPY